MSAAITASASSLIDISVGSVLRAILEANAAIALWVQWLVLLTLQTTRASTSNGADLDSWMADFSFSRLPAISAFGTATFSRFSSIASAFIPVGTIVKTQDGSVSFSIASDPTNPAWLAASCSYSLAPGVTSIDLPIIASVAGLPGNVLASTITLLASAVPGIDSVSNGAATIGGSDPETDAAFRVRFTDFFAARSRATLDAIGYAISLVGSDLSYVIRENVDATGNPRLGNMLIIVDDGSALLSDALLASLSIAIGEVRPVGTSFSIQPPQVIPVQVSLSVEIPPELSTSTVQNTLQAAITMYVSGRPIGSTLSITRISQIAYQTEPGIINIANVTLNGGTADLIAQPTASFMFQSVTFS
jgi:uncharacterized phage protein gp47/JayE